MWCADCERVEQFIFDETSFWIHLPTTDSFGKVAAFCGANGYEAEQFNSAGIRVDLQREAVDHFITQLYGSTSALERTGARIVTTVRGMTPRVETLGRVTDLDTFINRYKSEWIIVSMENGSYESWYQPIVSAGDSTRIEAHEALFRMRDEAGSIIPPNLLFRMAETSALLFSLDLVARRSAVETASLGGLGGKIFINFNPSSIYDPAYCLRTTAAAINELGLKADDIVFEITETYRVTDKAHLKGILAFYRNAGFRVALDDIGSGWSGLSMLHDFAPDYVKIDMDLVRDVHENRMKQTIVRHLIEIAKSNGIITIAEGIECEDEAQWLRSAGADLLQGFFFGKPAPLTLEEVSTADIASARRATGGLGIAAGL